MNAYRGTRWDSIKHPIQPLKVREGLCIGEKEQIFNTRFKKCPKGKPYVDRKSNAFQKTVIVVEVIIPKAH